MTMGITGGEILPQKTTRKKELHMAFLFVAVVVVVQLL